MTANQMVNIPQIPSIQAQINPIALQGLIANQNGNLSFFDMYTRMLSSNSDEISIGDSQLEMFKSVTGESDTKNNPFMQMIQLMMELKESDVLQDDNSELGEFTNEVSAMLTAMPVEKQQQFINMLVSGQNEKNPNQKNLNVLTEPQIDVEKTLSNIKEKISFEFGKSENVDFKSFAESLNLASISRKPQVQSFEESLEMLGSQAQDNSIANIDTSNFDLRMAKAEAFLKEPEIAKQLNFGIKETLSQGEFVMKLQPESLGEVTIKLLNEDGKQVLHIITETAQASKLINEDLMMLRNIFRPLQIEVRDSYSTSTVSETHNSEFRGFNMSQNNNFGGQQWGGQNQQMIYFAQDSLSELELEVSDQPQAVLDNLSIYV